MLLTFSCELENIFHMFSEPDRIIDAVCPAFFGEISVNSKKDVKSQSAFDNEIFSCSKQSMLTILESLTWLFNKHFKM